jgi:pyridinium-3,5-biscarboxylic acid mononucleotide sulfurtransferase
LNHRLQHQGSLLVAYSGGVDSAYLAYAAHQVLGERMLAAIADSPSLARAELADAEAFAREQGLPLEIVVTHEIESADYIRNDSARCFYCKDELFGVLEPLARSRGLAHIAFGLNVDDQNDFRPGQDAARRHGVAAPLAEANLTKAEIRELARAAGLRIWDKPAAACLSSRIQYGMPVTPEALLAVERGEQALHALGFRQVRVRHHGETVRIEIGRDELPRALTLSISDELVRTFKQLGFSYVTLDLEGYRSGSMNAVLTLDSLRRGIA